MGEGMSGLREEQVWIGGTPYSPHGSQYVPPSSTRVLACLEDLCAYANREDVPPIVKTAIVHAQFEAIHPFADGNGRTGRTLLHKMLRFEGVLSTVTLPVSAGLLNNVDAYLLALDSYHEGQPLPIISCLCDALEIALVLGERARVEMGEVLSRWKDSIQDRAGSAIHRLPALLVQHPVVDAAFVASELGITSRAALNLVGRAEEYGILRRVGTARRGVFYQADELIDPLNEHGKRTDWLPHL